MIRNEYNSLNEEQHMLLDIQKLEFALYDLALYLDTHPNDPIALYKHQVLADQHMQVQRAYESKYGIMSVMSRETGDTWRYINAPWPWER
ncbi:MAG TPA: spore coat protein CotJB [Clostridiales bacterium]|nr:spore coat protein CotJB [Clostridiales bacterium]